MVFEKLHKMKIMQKAVVAGTFYPADAEELAAMLQKFFIEAQGQDQPLPQAIVAPHAGYVYSGPIAASAYACLNRVRNQIKRVIVVAPSHRYPFTGIATSSADVFATPLGEILIDRAAIRKIAALPQITQLDAAFASEHSLEVQLPFLQMQLQDFQLIPLLVGMATPKEVAEVLAMLWAEEGTLLVVSSDLSHYHNYQTAQKIDSLTAQKILALDYNTLDGEQACGYMGLQGLLWLAKQKGWCAKCLDLRNSGDTMGEKDHVVGYGAFHFAK